MLILGIESSCDETAVAVVNDRRERLADLVLSQDPDVGERVDKGSRVTLSVSSGPATAEFPNVVDTEVGAAQRQIQDQGFTAQIAVETQVSNDVQPGTVVRQSPSPGPQPGSPRNPTFNPRNIRWPECSRSPTRRAGSARPPPP